MKSVPWKDPGPLDNGHLRRFTELLPLAAIAVDGTRVCLNSAAQDLTGYHSDDVPTLEEFFRTVLSEDSADTGALHNAQHRHALLAPINVRLNRKDGRRHRVEISVKAADGAEIWLLRDVTEMQPPPHDPAKEGEDEKARTLQDAQARQAQKLESLSVLAGGIAHDFNNLLTTILGYTSLARMELPAESNLQEYLAEVEKASRRAAELTQQMLAYSGKGRFHLLPLRIDQLVRDMLPDLAGAVGKQAHLQLDLPAGLAALDGDAQQLRQVLMSLVCNAAEAMNKTDGLITIRAGRKYLERPHLHSPFPTVDPSPGWFVFLQIQDNGAGMSHDVLARIFDPFYSTKFAGRGLGMAAVLGIVKGHKGLIHVDSEPGQGTTVEILFPM